MEKNTAKPNRTPGDPAMGARIRHLRELRGWQQPDLGKRIGVSRVTIGRWERGIQKVPVRRLRELAEEFEVAPGVLLGQEPSAPHAPAADGDTTVGNVVIWLSCMDMCVRQMRPVLDSLESATDGLQAYASNVQKSIAGLRIAIEMLAEQAAIGRRTLREHPEMKDEDTAMAAVRKHEHMDAAMKEFERDLEPTREAQPQQRQDVG